MNSPAYKAITYKMSGYLQHQAGLNTSDAARYSLTAITSQVNKESYIQAIDDDFLIAGIITIIGIIPVFWLHDKKNKDVKMEDYEQSPD